MNALIFPYQETACHRFRANTLGALAITAFAAMAGCSSQPTPVERPMPVHVVEAQSGTNHTVMTLSGTIVPRVETPLSFRVSGKIEERLVEAGTTISRGEVLARLDQTAFKLAVQEASAELAQAQATLAQLRRDVARNRELARSGVTAGASFDALRTRQANAQAQVHAARSRLKRAQNDLSYTALVAPADGTIAEVHAQKGQVVMAGTPMFRLAQGGEPEIQVDVPENRIARIKQTQPAKVRILSLPDVAFVGHVREVASVADPVTRTYRVRVALPKLPDTARLGMTASVHVEDITNTQVKLPITALFQKHDQPAVWVLPDGAKHLVLRPITLASMDSDNIVIARGIAPGERVVVAGVHRLDDKLSVQAWDGRLP